MYIVAAIILLLLVGALGAFSVWQRRSGAAACIRRAVPISTGELALLDQREGRAPRWLRASLDGRLLGEISVEGTPIAWTEQHLWTLESGRVRVYQLPTLSLVPAAAAALGKHPVLARGLRPEGLDGEALVVRGDDRTYYSIDPSGEIRERTEDLNSLRRMRAAGIRALPPGLLPAQRTYEMGTDEPMPLVLDTDSGGYRDRDATGVAATLDPSAVAGIHPRILMNEARGVALALDAPPSFLVVLADRTGLSPSHRVSRVGLDGSAQWTADAAALFGPSPDARAAYRVLFAARRADDLVLLVNSYRVTAYQSGRQEDCDVRFVIVDPTSGRARSRAPLSAD